MIAATPRQGGATWAVLQYLLGLRDLGCDVTFVEPVADAERERVEYARAVLERFGFTGHWALVDDDGDVVGMTRAELQRAAGDAALLLNVSGMLTDADVLERVPVRVYLDLDPAFVQLWHAVEHVDMRFDAHTHFVTVADTVGRVGSPIPDCGRAWIPTLPPVVLREWPVANELVHNALTTVGHWRGYGSVEHAGLQFGQKAHSLRPLIDLPTRIATPFLLALAIHPDETKDLDALRTHGWRLVDPDAVASTPADYRTFVQGSRAEFGVAKSGYVVSDSGWFSDRSACYLASGRPVIAQETGFSRRLPTGEGLFTFRDADDVLEAVDALERDEARHRRRAREIAEEHLRADRVLGSLLAAVDS
jgi:hypothetical protein